MEERLEQYPGCCSTSQPIATRVDEGCCPASKRNWPSKLFGPDLDVLAEKGQAIETVVKQIEGARDVAMEQIAGESQPVVKPDRRALSRYGLAAGDVMELVREGLGGASAGQIINGNERYDIYVRLDKRFRQDRESIADLRLQAPSGPGYAFGDVQARSASTRAAAGAPRRRAAPRGDPGQCGAATWAAWSPISARSSPKGGFAHRLLDRHWRPIREPAAGTKAAGDRGAPVHRPDRIAALLRLPFGRPGAADSGQPAAGDDRRHRRLFISGQYLSVPSSIGFITLFGVAVLNGVVMVEAINLRIEMGDRDIGNAVFRRCGVTAAAGVDDRHRRRAGPDSHAAVQRRGFGDPAAIGNRDRRRTGDLDLPDPVCAAGAVRPVLKGKLEDMA